MSRPYLFQYFSHLKCHFQDLSVGDSAVGSTWLLVRKIGGLLWICSWFCKLTVLYTKCTISVYRESLTNSLLRGEQDSNLGLHPQWGSSARAFAPRRMIPSRIFLVLKERWWSVRPSLGLRSWLLHDSVLQKPVHQRVCGVVSDESMIETLHLHYPFLTRPVRLITCWNFPGGGTLRLWNLLRLGSPSSSGCYFWSPGHFPRCGTVLRKGMFGPSALNWKLHQKTCSFPTPWKCL